MEAATAVHYYVPGSVLLVTLNDREYLLAICRRCGQPGGLLTRGASCDHCKQPFLVKPGHDNESPADSSQKQPPTSPESSACSPSMKTSNVLIKIHRAISIRNRWAREALAELLSTFVMMLFGLGSVAQVVLGKHAFGQYLSINLSFGIGVTMGIHVAGGVSGAHMNCAVSLTNCILGKLPWGKLPVYVLSQILGAFMAAAVVYCLYYEALYNYCGGNFTVTGPLETASIFATYPESYLSTGGGFLDQVVGTGALLLCLLAINDRKNSPALDGTQSVVVGLLVTVIGMSMGMNSGYAINPARDLGPRLFTAIAGWGTEVFRAGNYWCWIPIVAPLVGSLTGAFLYKLFVGLHHQPEEDTKEQEMEKGLPEATSEYM